MYFTYIGGDSDEGAAYAVCNDMLVYCISYLLQVMLQGSVCVMIHGVVQMFHSVKM